MKLRDTLLAGALAFAANACGTEEEINVEENSTVEAETIGKGTGKEDAWDYRNNPERLTNFVNKNLEYNIAELPKSGEAANKPWPASYWPTWEDSTNHRWREGELSPMEKFDLAFNDWELPSGFMELRPYDASNCAAGFDEAYYASLGPAASWMSRNKGNRKSRELYTSEGVDCDKENPVETWWGLCHAWAPAANLELEPIYPVTVNGATFYPADIKALILTVYDGTKSVILGGRCNTKEVERDENGRIKDPECRDTNAGSFHLSLANLLGRYGMSFQEDRTYDYQVWNQPILDYEVTQYTEIDAAAATKLLLGEDTTETAYPYNDEAKRFAEVFTTVQYITESHQEDHALIPEIAAYTRSDNNQYVLEMDADGNIIGGEWLQGRTGHSAWGVSEQPDFLWITTGPSDYRSNPHVGYDKVKELIALSRKAPEGDDADSDNADLRSFGYAGDPIAIPDEDPTGISADVHIDETITSAQVEIQVDIKHTYIGDLVVTLTNENGFSEILHEKSGGSADDLVINKVLTDLTDQDLKGKWTLTVSDHVKMDTGKLMTWAIIAR